MAQHKVTIDVEARFIDHLTNSTKGAEKAIDNLEKAAEDAQRQLNKTGNQTVKPRIDADTSGFDKGKDKVDRTLDKLNHSKAQAKLDALDEASKKIDSVLEKAKAFANKVYEGTVKIKDNEALSHLSKINEHARNIAGKTWQSVVRVRDMALAPLQRIRNMLFSIKTLAAAALTGFAAQKFVIGPNQMYANYEDLVTQFKVLLGSQEAAQKRIDELTTFAGQTPFTRDEIYQASRVLQNYTEGALATPDATGGLKMIGDIAAATGSEYTQVAQYMGRLYNEIGRINKGAKPKLGEPLAFLREMGALSAEQEEKITDIATGSGTVAQKWEKIAAQFSKTDGMMEEMSNQMNNLMLGVSSFLKNNVWMKLGEGINRSLKPFLADFRTWRNENKGLIADMAKAISDFAAKWSGKVLSGVKKFGKMFSDIITSDEFKNASGKDKFKMLWNGLVKDPLAEWWDGGGKEKTILTANKIGVWLGQTLSKVLLAAFGATEGLDGTDIGGSAGASIAAAFVTGFKENFDGGQIASAFMDAVQNIWKAMPTWAKVLLGVSAASKGSEMLQNLAGGATTMMDVGKSILGPIMGTPGNATSKGTGLTSLLAGLGYKMAGGAASATTLTGTAAATLGAGAVGGVAGGLYGGYQLYNGYKEYTQGQESGSQATQESGALKMGGTLGGGVIGATMGAAIGSVVPVIGTGIGALVGAGIGAGGGGFFGKIAGDSLKKTEATKMRLEELKAAAAESTAAAEEMERRQKLVAESLSEAFGDVTLSYDEVKDIASQIVTGKNEKQLTAYTSAAKDAATAFSNFGESAGKLNKLNWKASLGMEFTDDDKTSYKDAVKDFISKAEESIDAEHYEFKASVDLLLDPKSEENKAITKSGDTFYSKLQKDLDSTEVKLNKEVDIALKDGVITADEAAIIEDLQNKISEITGKLNQAENEAELEAIKIKFSSGELSQESFTELQTELQTQLEKQTLNYDEALKTSITSLKLQLDEGAINQEEYDKQIQSLTEGYNANIEEAKASVEKVQFEILAGAFDDVLGEDGVSQLQTALESSLKDGISPVNWTADEAKSYLNVSSLSEGAASAIGEMLGSIDMSTAEIAPIDVPLEINPDAVVPEESKADLQAADFGINEKYEFPTATDVLADSKVPESNKFKGTKADFGIQDSYNKSTTVNLSVSYNVSGDMPDLTGGGSSGKKGGKSFRGGLYFGNETSNIPAYANGGMVRGGSKLIQVAEEGSPEMIIPLSSQRRERGIMLWEKAGNMLGIPGFARGGLTNGQSDEGLRFQRYDSGEGAGTGGQDVQVDMGGVTVQVNVNGNDTNNISEAIKAQAGEIADTVAGIFADALGAQFANTPTRGGA